MINRDMRIYDYFLYTADMDEYGQRVLTKEPQGKVKMAVYIAGERVVETPLFTGAEYTGFTLDTRINDTYVVACGGMMLKVLFVQPSGRYKRVFMARV